MDANPVSSIDTAMTRDGERILEHYKKEIDLSLSDMDDMEAAEVYASLSEWSQSQYEMLQFEDPETLDTGDEEEER